jgi:hypothetical protein
LVCRPAQVESVGPLIALPLLLLLLFGALPLLVPGLTVPPPPLLAVFPPVPVPVDPEPEQPAL